MDYKQLKNILIENYKKNGPITETYIGPIWQIYTPSVGQEVKFPSIADIINESSVNTGMYIPENKAEEFDIFWNKELKKGFKSVRASDELEAYLTSGFSNERLLKIQVMAIPADTWFRVHAHPNIEFEMTLFGSLEELRMIDLDLWGSNDIYFSIPIDELPKPDLDDGVQADTGPDIDATTHWIRLSTPCGSFLTNKIGSVHQSFSGPNGAVMILLWSGCHCAVRPERISAKVDSRLRPSAGWIH